MIYITRARGTRHRTSSIWGCQAVHLGAGVAVEAERDLLC